MSVLIALSTEKLKLLVALTLATSLVNVMISPAALPIVVFPSTSKLPRTVTLLLVPPILIAASWPKLIAVMLALKMLAVPVFELAIAGLVPFMLNAVPLVIVRVGFLTVTVPDAAPISMVPAAPNAFTVVATVLNKFCVTTAPTKVALLIVVVPAMALPIFTLVVDPLAPPVPILTVLVVAVAVGAVAKL